MFKKKEIIDSAYEVLFPIHKTLYGESYRVKGQDGKIYMLKVYDKSLLPPDYFTNNGELKEAFIHSQLNHPNIVKYVHHKEFEHENKRMIYYVVDFISGETLKERIDRQGPPTSTTLIKIIEQICNAISYLHGLAPAVIHGDITPMNIMLDYTNDSKPLLFDFGIARTAGDEVIKFNETIPSVYYAAPELINGAGSTKSDIFSVGGLLYFMLTGDHPWGSTGLNSDGAPIADIVKKRESPLIFPLNCNIDVSIKNATLKSLFQNPLNRFHTIDSFLITIKNKELIDIHIDQKPSTPRKKGEGFKKIAGMEKLKESFQQDVIEPLLNPENFKLYGIDPPNGVLFFGPPGCGKTFFAECLAEEVGFYFKKVTPSDVGSTYVHGGKEKIKGLFEEARENAPAILFLDEIDAMIPERGGESVGHHYESEVNEWLVQLNNCAKNNIFIIGATNRPNKIDKAVMRAGRFDRKIEIPIPDLEMRTSLFRFELGKREKVIDTNIDYGILGQKTEGFVCSDISLICMDAARLAFRRKTNVTQSILLEIIENASPSLSEKEISQYKMISMNL